MGELNDKIKELDRLEEQYRQERSRIYQTIENMIRDIGQNPAISPIGPNIFKFCYRELKNSPWLPEFHDWSIQAEYLLSLLNKKPTNQWITFIEALLNKKIKNGWQGIIVDKIQLNRKFLLKVRELL